MTGTSSLADCRAARLPKDALAALAPLRRAHGIRIVERADEAWAVWDGEMPSIVAALLPTPGVTLFTRHADEWRPLGTALPAFDTPTGDGSGLDRALLPVPVCPVPPPQFAGRRIAVALSACSRPRPTSALRVSTREILTWADTATTRQIAALEGIVHGGTAWLRGAALPALAGAERFWGERLLVPLGLRPDPDWPEGALRAAAVVDDDEILVLTPAGPEALPAAAFKALTRAAIRRLNMKP